jgi:hypothetical protein
VTAPTFSLPDLEGASRDLDGLRGGAGLLLVFAERDCPTSVATLRALAGSGARMAVVSQGRIEAALDLAAATGVRCPVLVEDSPYPVSASYDLVTVPTLVLIDPTGEESGRVAGWDREAISRLVSAVGGTPTPAWEDLPETKPGCGSRNTYDAQAQAQLELADAALGEDGIEEMWRRGWTDGLPVVPPTRERVAAMLGGRDGAESLGLVPPVGGELTLERLAACAVMAGCAPTYFPVVRAAAEAILDDAFNLHGVQNTTHSAAPVVIVNGPVRREIGMGSGSNALGFGNRANATIGRTLRLVMCLTGGGTPGGLDQSTLGGPHKLGLCFGEHEEVSPWEPLHVERGYDVGDSTVTVMAGESPAGVSDHYSQDAEGLATTLTAALQSAWADTWYPLGAETVLVLCPEHATTFAQAGWSKDDLRQWIFTHAIRTAGELRRSRSGEQTPFVGFAEDDATPIGKFLAPDEIVIVVTGGEAGRFSAVIAPWVGFGLGSAMVTRRVEGP